MVSLIEKVTLWVVRGVSYGWSVVCPMGDPWCVLWVVSVVCPTEKVTIWVVRGMPYGFLYLTSCKTGDDETKTETQVKDQALCTVHQPICSPLY